MLKARWQNSYPIRELEQCDHVGASCSNSKDFRTAVADHVSKHRTLQTAGHRQLQR